jgi:hypothetical protein
MYTHVHMHISFRWGSPIANLEVYRGWGSYSVSTFSNLNISNWVWQILCFERRFFVLRQINNTEKHVNIPIQKHRSCDCQNPCVFTGTIDMIETTMFLYGKYAKHNCQTLSNHMVEHGQNT